MPQVILTDTSCLIILSKIGHLDILEKLYTQIYITPEIYAEYGQPLPNELVASILNLAGE